MLQVAILVLAGAVVVSVAFVFVGWAVGRTEHLPERIVVDAHDAIEFCAQAVPLEVSSRLSYEELRKILRLHLEWIAAYDTTPKMPADTVDDAPIIFEQFDPVQYILERAEVNRLELDREDVAAVVAAHSSFLQVMGAIHIEDPTLVEQDLAELPKLEKEIADIGPGSVSELDHQEEGGDPV